MGRRDRVAALLLCGTLLAAGSVRADPQTRNLTLVVGEGETVRFPPGTDLAVSRRGVIDLFHARDGVWQVTALKTGFAVVDGKDARTGESRPPRLFVTVVSPGEEGEAMLPRTLPEGICSGPGIRCDESTGILDGTTADPLRYLAARAACSRSTTCIFALRLSEPAAGKLRARLEEQLGDRFRLASAGRAPWIVTATCGANGKHEREAELDALTDGALDHGFVFLRCVEEEQGLLYRLAAKIFLVESAVADELGFSSASRLEVSAPGGGDHGLMARLRALASTQRAEILGQPVLRLAPSEPVEVVNGGEFQVLERDRERGTDVSTWKQHGLALKLTVTPSGKERARLAFDLSLKSRLGAGSSALKVNALKSHVDVTLGRPLLLGLLDLEAKGDGTSETPPFAALPLIGPLFRLGSRERSQSRLGFWLDLSADSDAPLSGPWTKSGPDG